MNPTKRRVLYRRNLTALVTSAEIVLPSGSVYFRIKAHMSPQERRALMLALFRTAKPWLVGIRKFSVNHLEFGLLDLPYSKDFLSRIRQPISKEAHRFGCTVRLIRLHSGWTLYDLSRASRISAPHLSEIERGLRRVRPMTHLRLERALGTSLPEIPKVIKSEKRISVKNDGQDHGRTSIERALNRRTLAMTPSILDLLY